MAVWVKTEDLKEILPKTLTIYEIEYLTGVNAKRIFSIRTLRTEFTDFYVADAICTGLDRIADFNHLETIENRSHHRKHGIQAYNRENCRCEVCKLAKRSADRRYREKRAKLRTDADSN